MVGNTCQNVRYAVSINVAHGRYRKSELSTKLLALLHLKVRVFQFSDLCQGGAVDHENFADILGGTFPGLSRKLSVVKWCSHCQIGHSVAIDITDNGDRAPKKRRRVFRGRVEYCRRSSRCD